jgi:hypothetical protein
MMKPLSHRRDWTIPQADLLGVDHVEKPSVFGVFS